MLAKHPGAKRVMDPWRSESTGLGRLGWVAQAPYKITPVPAVPWSWMPNLEDRDDGTSQTISFVTPGALCNYFCNYLAPPELAAQMPKNMLGKALYQLPIW